MNARTGLTLIAVGLASCVAVATQPSIPNCFTLDQQILCSDSVETDPTRMGIRQGVIESCPDVISEDTMLNIDKTTFSSGKKPLFSGQDMGDLEITLQVCDENGNCVELGTYSWSCVGQTLGDQQCGAIVVPD